MALNLTGIIEIDLHGMNTSEANAAIDDALRKATDSVYRIRCIHGFNRGTAIRSMIYDEYSNGRHKKVKKIQGGFNEGITELILREY